VCGGTNADFYELNTQRPPLGLCDGLCYAMNPQVHTSDDAAVMEALEGQGATVETARDFGGRRPVRVTPVTLKPRVNPAPTQPAAAPPPGELPPSVDPRQRTPFAAAWTVGTLASLAEAGAAGVTLFETTGWRGLMEAAAGPLLPARFASRPGEVFPGYHVLADVAPFAGARVRRTVSSHPLRAAALALEKGGRFRLLAANLTDRPQEIRL